MRQLLQVINLLDEFLAKKAKHNTKWGQSVARQDGKRCRRWTLKPTMTSAPRPGAARPTRATVLLNARGAQTRKAVGFKRTLPGEEFLFGELVATWGFVRSDRAAAYSGDYPGLATGHPSLGFGRWQIAHVGACSDNSSTTLFTSSHRAVRGPKRNATRRRLTADEGVMAASDSSWRITQIPSPALGGRITIGVRIPIFLKTG